MIGDPPAGKSERFGALWRAEGERLGTGLRARDRALFARYIQALVDIEISAARVEEGGVMVMSRTGVRLSPWETRRIQLTDMAGRIETELLARARHSERALGARGLIET